MVYQVVLWIIYYQVRLYLLLLGYETIIKIHNLPTYLILVLNILCVFIILMVSFLKFLQINTYMNWWRERYFRVETENDCKKRPRWSHWWQNVRPSYRNVFDKKVCLCFQYFLLPSVSSIVVLRFMQTSKLCAFFQSQNFGSIETGKLLVKLDSISLFFPGGNFSLIYHVFLLTIQAKLLEDECSYGTY